MYENPVQWAIKIDDLELTIGRVRLLYGVVVLNEQFHFAGIPTEVIGKPIPFIEVISIIKQQEKPS